MNEYVINESELLMISAAGLQNDRIVVAQIFEQVKKRKLARISRNYPVNQSFDEVNEKERDERVKYFLASACTQELRNLISWKRTIENDGDDYVNYTTSLLVFPELQGE